MPVSDKHSDYTKYSPQWAKVQDCVAGSDTIKKAGKKYLPRPSARSDEDYAAYVFRANFINFVNHTKKGMIGMVFRKKTITEVQTAVQYALTDMNGGGLTLDQMTRSILSGVLDAGRFGLLVDFPQSEEGKTKAQTKGLQATILPYCASEIINWRTTVIDGVKKLSLVVLAEAHEKLSADGFAIESVMYHRALKIVDGVYVQELYDEDDKLISTHEPRDYNGATWKEIPFIFIGAENNDETVDDAPLYDLAEPNLGHYRNSADYEESSFQVGQATPWLAGLTDLWVKDVLKGTVQLGSRAAIFLPEGGSAGLLQAEPNSQPIEGMREKELQMVKIGARIIQDNSGQETAEAAKIRFSGQNSELAGIVGNIEAGLVKAFEWLGVFMGAAGDSIIEINKEFYAASLTAQQVMALIQLADRGDVAQGDVRLTLRKSGWLSEDRTDEDIDEEAEASGAGLGELMKPE